MTSTAWGELTIRLDATFPSNVRQDLQRVADDVLRTVNEIFNHTAPPLRLPIICSLGPPPPRTSLDHWAVPTQYRINVSVRDRKYDQFAYQLSHELAHIMIGVYRTNSTIETLAVAVSLETLDRLAERWHLAPPHKHWAEYAGQFYTYRQDQEAEAFKRTGLTGLRKKPSALKRKVRAYNASIDASELSLGLEYARDYQIVASTLIRSALKDRWHTAISLEQCAAPPPTDKLFRYASFTRTCAVNQLTALAWLIP